MLMVEDENQISQIRSEKITLAAGRSVTSPVSPGPLWERDVLLIREGAVPDFCHIFSFSR